jgi:hypothetical protein
MSEATASVSSTTSQTAAPDAERSSEISKKEPATSNKLPASAAKSTDSALPTAASVTGGKVGAEKPQESAPSPKETKEEVKKEAERRHKLKVNGQEREYTEAEVLRRAQLAEAADEKFKTAAEKEKHFAQFFEALRANPLAVLTHPELGINFREVAENFLGEHVRKEMMDPVERELEELREFKRQQEESRTKAEEEGKKKQMTEKQRQLHQQATEYYDRKISDVLQASNLPKTPNTIKRVAEVLQNAVNNGYELDVETAVDLVNEDYRGDIGSLTKGLDGEALIGVLGEEVVKKIRSFDIARMKAKLAGTTQPAAEAEKRRQPSTQQRDQSKQFLTESEWKAEARKRFLGG